VEERFNLSGSRFSTIHRFSILKNIKTEISHNLVVGNRRRKLWRTRTGRLKPRNSTGSGHLSRPTTGQLPIGGIPRSR
jgi:hypothetical protein